VHEKSSLKASGLVGRDALLLQTDEIDFVFKCNFLLHTFGELAGNGSFISLIILVLTPFQHLVHPLFDDLWWHFHVKFTFARVIGFRKSSSVYFPSFSRRLGFVFQHRGLLILLKVLFERSSFCLFFVKS